jgi:hypothetical protein
MKLNEFRFELFVWGAKEYERVVVKRGRRRVWR